MPSGLITSLQGCSLKKELFGDALYYRDIRTWSYEIYAVNTVAWSPKGLQDAITNEFASQYSGDINVKVFSRPADYYWPNDGVRAAKYNVEVQVRTIPALATWESEIDGANYKGLDSTFFTQYGTGLLDFKENFDLETADNGIRNYSHSISFGLLNGSRSGAASVASYIFDREKQTPFGILAMANMLSTVADTGIYQNYWSETYDTIRNNYSFTRKRSLQPLMGTTYVYNMSHIADFKDDGNVDVTEKGNVVGQRNFESAHQAAMGFIGSAYARCATMFSTYAPWLGAGYGLSTTPVKTTLTLNKPALIADYDVTFTNNPQFKTNGTSVEETMEISDEEIGVVGIKHSFNFTRNKRLATSPSSIALISGAIISSPTTVNAFQAQYYPNTTFHLIKKDVGWPAIKPKGAKLMMEYSNHPKYFVTIGGQLFNTFEAKITNTKPTDILTEYKIINRPQGTSVINYAYQTERGQIVVQISAGIGRQPDEFTRGFRSDFANVLSVLFNHASQTFYSQFVGQIPLAFTYFLNDIKYTYNSEMGGFELTATFTYAIKKYAP